MSSILDEGSSASAWRKRMMDWTFLGTALFFNTFTAPMVKFTQNSDGSYSYNSACIYFFAELLKLAVSVGWCAHYWFTHPDMRQHLRFTTRDFFQYAIPGFVFFAQNNLSFIALRHLSNSAFQLLLNLRIISVGLLSVFFLAKKLNYAEWLAMVLLTNGAVQHQLSHCGEDGSIRTSAEGLTVMFAIVMCAAGGNVATQKVMQKNMDQPLMLQNAILYLWGIAFNGVNWVYSTQSAPSGSAEWLGVVGFPEVSLIVFNAVYGFSISVILKRFGAITRTFVSTVAIVCTGVVDVWLFSETINFLEATSFVAIIGAILLFSIIAKNYDAPKA